MKEDIQEYYGIVEKAIQKIGINPVECREEKVGQWSLRKGETKVWVDIFNIEKEGRAYFQCMSPIMKTPLMKREAFYKELLEINDGLFGVAFSIYKEQVWVKVLREAIGMDEQECHASIIRIGTYGSQYTTYLMEKYPNDQAPPGPVSDAG
jgi:hypothetical protein